MEQQTVSVAKAGVVCSLPARTCVFAAANPTDGHYNLAKSFSDNVKVTQALLSRFDLMFILLDQPDPHLDNLLTAHIQALHANNQKSQSKYSNRSDSVRHGNATSDQLLARLRLTSNEYIDTLPHELMQKYIAYARKTVQPELSTEAAAELKRFYLEIRKVQHGNNTIRVTTTRQLEAMIRLTQARARTELAAEATLQHAEDVISIIRLTMTTLDDAKKATPVPTTSTITKKSHATQVIIQYLLLICYIRY